MTKSIDYHGYLIESLKDSSEAAGYLNAALADGDIDGFLEALRNVVEAQGGMTQLSEKSSKGRNSLYKTICGTGNPYLRNTNEILQALGFHLSVTSNRDNQRVHSHVKQEKVPNLCPKI
jgi:probable addiction module antidote protein